MATSKDLVKLVDNGGNSPVAFEKMGEIIEFDAILPVKDVVDDSVAHLEYGSLTELNAEWEDAPEEPKEYWYIDYDGGILCGESDNSSAEKMMISMGNHFGSLEEAEKAVEKLKAWKRLKDNGFEFRRWEIIDGTINFMILPKGDYREKVYEDLRICFGGEE